jgi:cytochrome c peroxidase
MTWPYMHDGWFQGLTDVVNFYNQGACMGGDGFPCDPRLEPLGLGSDDVQDLVSFLSALTGTPPPSPCPNTVVED